MRIERDRRLKVLVVGKFIEPPFADGVVNTVLNWAKATQRAGVNVRILSISSKFSGSWKISDIRFEYVKTKRPRFQNSLVDLFSFKVEIMKQRDYDIVHFADSMDGLSSIPMLALQKIQKTRIVNSYPTSYLPKSTYLLRTFLPDVVTVSSRRMLRIFRRKKFPPQKMRLVPPCVNGHEFRPRDKFKVREELGLESDSFIIFTAGHFKYGRLLVPLIRTVDELAKRRSNIKLLIGWTGHGEPHAIKEIFSDAQASEFTEIIEPTNHINLYYNASDIYIMSASSNYVIETPLSIIEALLSGTPVITFDVNGSSEIVRDGINGYTISGGNFDEMRSKMVHLMNNVDLLEEFSKNCRNMAMSFSFEVVGNQLHNLYRELMEN